MLMDMTWRLGHRPALDGLRGIAILLVITSHLDHRYAAAGPVGVTVFFVLSGFLITSLLLEEYQKTGDLRFRAFYARRARRLFPALALLIVVVVPLQKVIAGFSPVTVLPVIAYVSNWVAATGGGPGRFQHTWSLAVEEQFYLLWPLLLILAAKLGGKRAVMWTALTGAGLSIALRFALWDGGNGAVRVRFGSDTNAAGLLLGCALAVWMTTRTPGRNRPTLAAVAIAGAALAGATNSLYAYTFTAPFVAMLATLGALVWLCQDGPTAPFDHRVLRAIGKRSYGWYLWHAPLLMFASFYSNTLGAKLLGLAVALAVAELSWRYVEQPFLRKRLDRGAVPPAADRPVDRLDRGAVPPSAERLVDQLQR